MAFDLATARPVGQSESMTGKEVVTQAVKSFPSSLKNVLVGTYEAVTSPLQTGKTVLDIGAGALQNVLPESVVKALGEDKASREVANEVGKMYVQRYGGVEQAKRTIANDPAGFLSDVSAVLTGGSSVAPKLGKAASMVDPLSLTAKAVGTAGKAVAPVLGMTTGAGAESFRQAYKAGREGGTAAEQFRSNITGTAPMTDVLDMAKQNLANMNQAKQAQYRSGMVNIKGDKTVLDFKGIDQAVQTAQNKTSYKGKVVNERAFNELQTVRDIVDDWKAQNPTDFHTPEGLDALKQRIGDVLENIPYEQKQARAAVGGVYDSVKSEITKQAPTYSKVMKEYSESAELIKEIERSLSLGQKASAETATRKLQSLMRKNVNTNFGQRVALGKQLTAAFSAGGVPLATASLLASSPRLMGEAAYGTGLLSRIPAGVETVIPQAFDPRAYNIMYQANRAKRK
jgi:hypothetical protein